MQKKKKKAVFLWKYKSGMSESYHFNFWDWDYYWLFEGLSPFRINNNNNKMDSLMVADAGKSHRREFLKGDQAGTLSHDLSPENCMQLYSFPEYELIKNR